MISPKSPIKIATHPYLRYLTSWKTKAFADIANFVFPILSGYPNRWTIIISVFFFDVTRRETSTPLFFNWMNVGFNNNPAVLLSDESFWRASFRSTNLALSDITLLTTFFFRWLTVVFFWIASSWRTRLFKRVFSNFTSSCFERKSVLFCNSIFADLSYLFDLFFRLALRWSALCGQRYSQHSKPV